MSEVAPAERPVRRPGWMALGDMCALCVVVLLVLICSVSYGGMTSGGQALLWAGCALLGIWTAIGFLFGRFSNGGVWQARFIFLAAAWPTIWLLVETTPLPASTTNQVATRTEAWQPLEEMGITLPEMLPLTLAPWAGRRACRYAIGMAAFFGALWMLCQHRKPARVVAWLLALCGFSEGIRGLLEFSVGASPRASGSLVNPNHFAAMIMLCLPMGIALTILRRRVERHRMDARAGVAAMMAGLVLTCIAGWSMSASRGSLLVGAPVICLWLAFEFAGRLRERGLHSSRQGIMAALVTIVALLLVITSASAVPRFTKRMDQADFRENDRIDYWQASLAGWRQTRTFGLGPGGVEAALTQYSRNPTILAPVRSHNDYIEVLADWGLAGVIPWVILIATAGVLTLKEWKGTLSKDSWSSGIVRRAAIAGVLSALAHAAFDFHLRIPYVSFCFLAALALALGKGSISMVPVRRHA